VYDARGTRKVGTAGSEQPFQEQVTTEVSRLGGASDKPDLRLRTETNGGTTQYDRRYAAARVQLLATDMSSAGLAYGGRFNPPQDLIRWPVQQGANWSSDWTLGSVQGHTNTTVLGTKSIAVAGKRYTCYELRSRSTYRGDAQGTQDTTSCWIAELGMVGTEHQVFKGSYNGVPFDSDVTTTLRRAP
jgi:hypothetical protein